MTFLIKFGFISYAAVVFFVLGLAFAISAKNRGTLVRLFLIFMAVAVGLSTAFIHESLQHRLLISGVWVSVLGFGMRFGRRLFSK